MIASGAIASSCARNSLLLRILSGCVTGKPAASAVCLTGGAMTSCLRPTGRSGCETTSSTSWPANSNVSSVGTANRGVPQKTSFTVLPFSFALQLADLAHSPVALESAHAEDEQDAVEVIDLVLECAREKFFAVHLEPFAVLVLGADFYLCRALHLFADFGKAEAAFFFVLLAFAEGDLGIDEHELLSRILAHAEIDHCDALRHGDLRRGQADALRRVHGLEHVSDELAQFVVEFGDGFARLRENRLGVFDDLQNHAWGLKAPDLFDVALEVSFQFEQRVAAELFMRDAGDGKRNHGLSGHARSGHHADIAALVTGRGGFARVEADGF